MTLELVLLEAYETSPFMILENSTDPMESSSMRVLPGSPAHRLVRFSRTAMPRTHTAAMAAMRQLTLAMGPSMGVRLLLLPKVSWPSLCSSHGWRSQ
jgi:hypothetical protein